MPFSEVHKAGTRKDPNYVNKGVKLILHYARMPQHFRNLYI